VTAISQYLAADLKIEKNTVQ